MGNKDFKLITKEGESISTVGAKKIEDAIEYFAWAKQIPEEELLRIYKVIKNENRNFD